MENSLDAGGKKATGTKTRRVDRQNQLQHQYSSHRQPPVIFEEGDIVFIRNFKPTAFGPRWNHSGRILRRTGDTAYDILINGRETNFHVDDIRLAPPGNLIPDDNDPYFEDFSSNETDPDEGGFRLPTEQRLSVSECSESDSEVAPQIEVTAEVHQEPGRRVQLQSDPKLIVSPNNDVDRFL